jgi:hypothetical protein
MHGNTLTRSIRAGTFMLTRPADGIRWWGERIGKGGSPMERRVPWTSWAAIDRLSKLIQPGWRVFEWGGGGSTLFFLDRGCEVVTVESHPGWMADIEKATAGATDRWRGVLCEAEDGNPEQVERYLKAVHEGGPWDLVLVDGFSTGRPTRMECLREGMGDVKPGGYLALDDAWRPELAEAPSALSGWSHETLRGLGPARPGVTRTDLYRKPA